MKASCEKVRHRGGSEESHRKLWKEMWRKGNKDRDRFLLGSGNEWWTGREAEQKFG